MRTSVRRRNPNHRTSERSLARRNRNKTSSDLGYVLRVRSITYPASPTCRRNSSPSNSPICTGNFAATSNTRRSYSDPGVHGYRCPPFAHSARPVDPCQSRPSWNRVILWTLVQRTATMLFDPTLDSVPTAETMVLREAENIGFDADELHEISISLRERMVNAIVHANRYGPPTKVDLSIAKTEDRLTVVVADQKLVFKPRGRLK